MGKIKAGSGLDMGNSFDLYLDTTGPTINIHAPNYTVKNSMTDFRIEGNERLAEYQDFYFIDSDGIRHDVIFKYDGDSFLGEIDFSQFAEGIAIFYAQIKDLVFNNSPVISHSILIHAGKAVDLEIRENARSMDDLEDARMIMIDSSVKDIFEIKIDRVIGMKEAVRAIGVDESG